MRCSFMGIRLTTATIWKMHSTIQAGITLPKKGFYPKTQNIP